MKANKTNKIGTIFLVSVLALAGIGISYAGWIDVITVTGTVQTGYVDFEITEYSGTWVWKYIPTHSKIVHTGAVADTDLDGNGLLDDDPVAYADGWYTDTDYELVSYSYAHNTVQTANEIVHFKFINLYPCVYFHADFKFTIGTIPVILTTTDINWYLQQIEGVAINWIEGLPGLPSPDVEVTLTDEAGNVVDLTADIIQLHPGITYTWDLIIHIPQHNDYMNAYAEGTVDLSIIQWNDECDDEQEDDKPGLVVLPPRVNPTPITVKFYHPWGDYYFKAVLSGTGQSDDTGPYNVWDGNWPDFCVDEFGRIWTGRTYTAHLWSTYDPLVPYPDPEWPNVNWIINNMDSYPTAGWLDFQEAIWYFIDGGNEPTTTLGQQIRNDALPHGDFIPQEGQLLAALVWPVDANGNELYNPEGPVVQKTFIIIDP